MCKYSPNVFRICIEVALVMFKKNNGLSMNLDVCMIAIELILDEVDLVIFKIAPTPFLKEN